MATDPLDSFKKVYDDFGAFCRKRGEVSEADTRVNILDRVVHDVLEWPRDDVHREVYANPGFVDYELVVGKPQLVIEAKKAGETFVFPHKKGARKRFKISGSLGTDKKIRGAVDQARRYCSERGIRYGVATNGYSFIIFRGVTDGFPWRDGEAIVFGSPKEVEARFTEFWNLVSYEAVSDGKLDDAFRPHLGDVRQYHRPVEMILDGDAPYDRNPLNVALRPYVDKFFGDIASQDNVMILEHCYVHTRPLQVIDENLKLEINDVLPKFADSAVQLKTSPTCEGGQIEKDVRSAAAEVRKSHKVVLLMGGIGSGKSTFLKRFFKVVIPGLVEENASGVHIYLDFLGGPDSVPELRRLLWKKLASILKDRASFLMKRGSLEGMFSARLSIMQEIYHEDEEKLTGKINDEIYKLSRDDEEFSRGALRHCVSVGRMPIIVFDNVDQLGLGVQIEVFTQCQNLARESGCMAILVLREESYCAAQMQKQLTAYTIRPYHLSSPSFRKLIRTRIDFAANAAAEDQRGQLLTQTARERQQVVDFFRLLRDSIFEKNKNIVRLVEAVSFGNARIALDLLNAFITSGATNMAKILDKYSLYGRYTVPFHEFAKSVILGDYRYYKEGRSFIMNVFYVTDKRNASHFSALRILKYLGTVRGADRDGEGFTSLQGLLTNIVDLFDNEQDCVATIGRLITVRRQLIELDTRRTDSLDGAGTVRITTAGLYYLKYFVNSFSYLDLVWHDTPFNDISVAKSLKRQIGRTDMGARFDRVTRFLEYLDTAETIELTDRALLGPDRHGFFGPFVPDIRHKYEQEKRVISRKLASQSGDS